MRPEVLWIGVPPDDELRREFAQRDLTLVFAPPPDAPCCSRARAMVLAIGPGDGGASRGILRARAPALLNHGGRIEVVAEDDATLGALLTGAADPVLGHDLVRLRVAPPAHRLAEDVARHDPGPLPRGDLDIAMGRNQEPLASRDVPLFRRAFHDCTRIVLVELTGGRSDARVFAVYANLAGSYPGVRPQPSFAKIDAHGKIATEFWNYRVHADRYIPFGLRPNVQGIVRGHERSLLVGDFVDRSESLWDLVRRGVAAQPLHALVDETLAGWREQKYAREPSNGSVARSLRLHGICRPEEIRPTYAERAGVTDTPSEIWHRLEALEGQRFRTAPIHGDLHGENVRVRNNRAILIDLASVKAEGPVTADLAALETWLAFELPPEDDAREWENVAWRQEVDRLYDPAAFAHPPAPCDPISPYHGIVAAVRQLREMGIAAQSCPGEYKATVAVLLLRRCQWEGTTPADRYRRATGYGIAARLARDLGENAR